MFIGMLKKSAMFSCFGLLFFLLIAREGFAVPEISEVTQQTIQRVIVNQSVQVHELSLNQLRSIFSLRARKWPDGTPITVFVLRDENEDHRQFLLKTLKMLPHQLRRQWDRFIYSGIGQGPVVVHSQQEMLSEVSSTPGAIGYLEGGSPNDQATTLSIQ